MQAKCSYSSTAAMQRVKNSILRKNNSPCKDCTNRHPGCHSKCSLYSDWKNAVSEKTVELLKSYAATNSGAREMKKRTKRYHDRQVDISRKGQKVTI